MPDLPPVPAELDLSWQCIARLRAAFEALRSSSAEGLCLDLAGLPPVPAGLVRWLLIRALPDFDPAAKRLSLWHATLTGAIALAGIDLAITPSFVNCRLDVIDLTDARARGLEILGGRLRCLRADRMAASGTVLLRGHRADPAYRYPLPTDIDTNITISAGLLLCGASIHGNLDLRGALVGALEDFQPPVAILADGLNVDGNILAGGGFAAGGELRLNGSTIGRDLNCAGASLSNPDGHTLSIVGAKIKGTLYLCRSISGTPLRSVGTMRLLGARVEGDLDASGAWFARFGWNSPPNGSSDPEALLADGIEVGGTVRLTEGFSALGQVRLVSAQIDGDLLCTDACFEFPGEDAFIADGATVGGTTDFSRASSSGLIRFSVATLRQGYVADNLIFDCDGTCLGWSADEALGGNVCGLHAAGAVIGGGFSWCRVTRWSAGESVEPNERVRNGRVMWLSLPRCAIAAMADDQPSWQHADRIDLRDTGYDRIQDLALLPGWRLDRLDREYAPWSAGVPDTAWSLRRCRLERRVLWHTWREQYCLRYLARCAGGGPETLADQIRRFIPGPYLQLARTMRGAGFATGADRVLIRLERNRTRYSGYGVPAMLGRWLLDLSLRYGQRPFRPLWFLLIWIVLTGVLFKWLHDATKTGKLAARLLPIDPAKLTLHPFQWLQFALDTLLPFVSLGQKANFVIVPADSWFAWLVAVNALIGYVLLAFLAAGLTGLVRTGGDGG